MKREGITKQPKREAVDLTALYFKFKEYHRNVFMHQIDNDVFIYRTLGRAEYKKIVDNEDITDFDREDIVCRACLLWPEDYDFDNCSAGLPTELCEVIIRASLLDSDESRKAALDYYRLEMHDFQNQITCLINEAFPNFDIEEIEEWDMEKTLRYLSRAEWKLHNLRGLEFTEPQGMDGLYQQEMPQEASERPRTQEVEIDDPEPKKSIRGGKKELLDASKLAELKRRFPEIPWDQDSVMIEGEKALQVKVDTAAGPLQTGL